mgnify:CR=1 FL=1
MDAFLTIVSKQDTRRYSDAEIPEEVTRRILEAARVSGNAMNRQNRRFVVLEPETRKRASQFITRPTNLEGAAFAVAIIATDGAWDAFDAGRAAQNMMLAAWAEGVASCPNAMADQDAMNELLGAEAPERVVTVVSFGYPSSGRTPDSRSESEWLERLDRVGLGEITTTV